MPHVKVEDLWLSYPVIVNAGSVRKALLNTLLGGFTRWSKEKNDIVMVDAIRGISFELEEGDKLGLIGHNGAGKTSLLKVLASIYPPTRGTVEIEGRVESFLATGFGLEQEETGRENIQFVLTMLGKPTQIVERDTEEIADFTELGEFLDLPVRTYSAGMRARLSFAISTNIKPEILLMDEVIGAGDVRFKEKAQERLEEIEEHTKIIVLATHSESLIKQWCNKAIWMEQGKVKDVGCPDELWERYKESMIPSKREQPQASPEPAEEANNVTYVAVGRPGNREGFNSTNSKYKFPLANHPITPASANAVDDDALATAQQPSESTTAPGTFPFTMVSGSLPPNAPRFVSATTAGNGDGDKSVTITGTDVTDTVVKETIDLPSSAATENGSQLFKTVTSATITGPPAANVELGVQASTQLIIAHAAHGRAVGDTVILGGSSSVDGVDAAKINTSHTLTAIVDADSYKIVALDSSSGTTPGGGNVVATSAVTTASDTITISSHGLSTGDFIFYDSGGGTAITGLSSGTYYYVVRENYNSFKLATNHATACARITIGFSGTGNNAQIFSYVTAKFAGLQGSPNIEQIFQFNNSSGDKLIATATVANDPAGTNKIFKLDSPYTDFEDITGSSSLTGNDWQFVDFNDKVVGALAGNTMIVYSGYNTFVSIFAASGTVPDGNIVHSAFGRLWAQKSDIGADKNIIAYSALLDEGHWSTGAGEINVLENVDALANGDDELVAISSFDGYLVAFLRNNIVVYDDPNDPGTLNIERIIQGVGCKSRDSVQQVGNDVYFLSDSGIRSLLTIILK